MPSPVLPFLPISRLVALLPSLVGDASLRLVASTHPIGFTDSIPVRVQAGESHTVVHAQNLSDMWLSERVRRLLNEHGRPGDDPFVAAYVGKRTFLPSIAMLLDVHRTWGTKPVAVVCGHLDDDQYLLLSSMLTRAELSAVGWAGCGAQREMQAIGLTLDGLAPDEAIRFTPDLAPAVGLSPDA